MSVPDCLVKALEEFIPKYSGLYKKENGDVMILHEDIDGDGVDELLGLFKQEDKIKLIAIKKQDGKWGQAWYKEVGYDVVIAVKMVTKYPCFLLLGKKNGMIGAKIFKWQVTGISVKDELESRFEHFISARIDGLTIGIGWVKEKSEHYEIELYEIEEEIFKKIPETDLRYLKYMETYATRFREEKVETHKENEGLVVDAERINILRSQSIIIWEEEWELFFIGKVECEKIYNPYLLMQSIHTRETITWEVPIKKIECYELIIGSFKEDASEQIFLSVNRGSEEIEGAWLLEILPEGIKEYLESHQQEVLEKKYETYISNYQIQRGSWQVYTPYNEETFKLFRVYGNSNNDECTGILLQRYNFFYDHLIKGETLLLQRI